MGKMCFLLADIYSYEAEFIQLVIDKLKTEGWTFNFKCSYDSLSINIPNFENWNSLINPEVFEITETTEIVSSASFPDIDLIFDSNGHICTRLYNTGDDFNC